MRSRALRIEGRLLLVGLVFGARQIGAEGEHVVRVETGIHALQMIEAAHQQSRAAEQHQSERDFADHEHAAQRVAPEADGVAAAAFAKRRDQIGLRHVDRRRETEQDAGQSGDRDGEQHHRGIQRDLIRARQNGRVQVDQQARSRPREQEPKGGAERGEQHALGEKLADQPSASRAQCVADADFAPPRGRAREQQVRQIDAGDQAARIPPPPSGSASAGRILPTTDS